MGENYPPSVEKGDLKVISENNESLQKQAKQDNHTQGEEVHNLEDEEGTENPLAKLNTKKIPRGSVVDLIL